MTWDCYTVFVGIMEIYTIKSIVGVIRSRGKMSTPEIPHYSNPLSDF